MKSEKSCKLDQELKKPSRLEIVPISLKDAKIWVNRTHRHHRAPQGGYFAVAVARDNEVIGVAIVGRTLSRSLDDGWTVEATRVAVLENQPNACSKLYAQAWKTARALGYRRMVTYTLDTEPGTSLRAAGWKIIGEVKGRHWHTPSRPRINREPLQDKLRWETDSGEPTDRPNPARACTEEENEVDNEVDNQEVPENEQGD